MIPECVSCQDFNCTNHTEDMEEYTMAVLEAVEGASKECLPSTGGGQSKGKCDIIPGWTEHVKSYSDESKFWKSTWQSAGQPPMGQLFENMKYSKRQYKYAVRRLKRCNDTIQNNKFLAGVVNGDAKIFDEIRKFRGKNVTFSSRIDDEVGSKNIAKHFANIYTKLYNKVENGETLEGVIERINSGVSSKSQEQLDRIDEKLIKTALNKMKSNKRDALFDTVSDCYKNGPPELLSHITNLVKLFLVHGSVPYFILLCTLIPLVKDNFGDITCSDNYRAIAGGCLLLKLLDSVILLLEGDKLTVSELQFAYQAMVSTTVCSWAVTSVVDHFNRQGAAVYGAAMDMSKAFDMVEWAELFSTLLDRKVDCLFLRLMLFIYRNQTCDVKWCGEYSHMAHVTLNGDLLPWVRKVVHLGCTLESDNSMKMDIANKRGKFIGKVNSLMQELHFATPEVLMKLINTYTTSFYGSPLWDILSADCERLYKSWNVTVRNVCNLERRTHRYLIEPLSGCLHPKVMLASRLVSFHKSLVNSTKFSVRFLARLVEKDRRTVLGSTLAYLIEECKIDSGRLEELTPGVVKRKMMYACAPESELWRIQLALELQSVRDDGSSLEGFSRVEVEEMLASTCVT